MKKQSIRERKRTQAVTTFVECRGSVGDAVESSARAGSFAKELEDATGPFAKELEVTDGPFVKGVVAPACKEDEACAFVLPPAPGESDDDLWLDGW